MRAALFLTTTGDVIGNGNGNGNGNDNNNKHCELYSSKMVNAKVLEVSPTQRICIETAPTALSHFFV